MTAMIAATPAMMPTSVSNERSLWAAIAATAILKLSIQVIALPRPRARPRRNVQTFNVASPERFYSYLNASIGASREARTAGHMPKTRPTTEQKMTPRTAHSTGTWTAKPVKKVTMLPSPKPIEHADHATDVAQHDRLHQELEKDGRRVWHPGPCGSRSRGCVR